VNVIRLQRCSLSRLYSATHEQMSGEGRDFAIATHDEV